MMNDAISDMLTRIRNGNLVGHKVVKIQSTRLNYELIRLLRTEGFVRQYETVVKNNQRYIFVYLKYSINPTKPIIRGLKRISKPGLRVYVNRNQLPTVLGGQGLAILSTSKGIITNSKAKQLGVGGELLFYIW
jgi:small subunit ribosomal protein S8